MLGQSRGPHSWFFDFDGTLYPGESLEEVLTLSLRDADDRDRRVKALEELGRRGMEGTLPFEESLRGRLDEVRPHRRHIAAWVAAATPRLHPLWGGLLSDLRLANHRIRVISGGFRDCIEPVVQALGVAREDVYCNDFRFDTEGWVVGLDEAQPLSRSGGKPTTVMSLAAHADVPGLRIIVGDGATDLEAVTPNACNAMIGLGAYAVRPTVRDGADVFFETVEDFDLFVRAHFL